MFAAVYRWRVRPGESEAFEEGWERVSVAVKERFGSLGSRLHRAADGTYMSYARWQDEPGRLAYQDHYRVDPIGFRLMERAVQEELEAHDYTIIGNLLEDGSSLHAQGLILPAGRTR
jgi:hypothetical protein